MARRNESSSSAEEAPAAPAEVAATAPAVENTAPAGDAPPAPPTPPTTPTEPEKLTPREWAHRKGLLFEPSEKQPWVEAHSTGFHAAASQLHGWNWYAQNFQDQAFTLTEADYDAALDAAGEFPALPAHEPALAPNFPKPVVPEHIAKACAEARAKAAAAAAAAAQKPGA
jgi:hypothetical protein